jgi:hypothetical protein
LHQFVGGNMRVKLRHQSIVVYLDHLFLQLFVIRQRRLFLAEKAHAGHRRPAFF